MICIYTGPMFAGKSEALFGAIRERGEGNCQAFKPCEDTRDAPCESVTHAGNRFAVTAVRTAGDILSLVRPDTKTVCIEEAQFFGAALLPVVRKLSDTGREVFLSCLDMDCQRLPFGHVGDLFAVADYVHKLRAVCSCCGGPAAFSRRIVPVDGRTFVGGAESYEPRCSDCWQK